MKVKDFLKEAKMLNLASIAAEMYPNLKNPRSNLNQKLHSDEDSPNKWKADDARKALSVLKKLSIDISKLKEE